MICFCKVFRLKSLLFEEILEPKKIDKTILPAVAMPIDSIEHTTSTLLQDYICCAEHS